MIKIGFVSLGCPKNFTDTEAMIGILKETCLIVTDPKEAEIIIVNTCGFIESAKQESINTILEMNTYRRDGCLKKLIVTGCLAQRYCDDLLKSMPEVDAVVGTGSVHEIESAVQSVLENKRQKYMGDINAPLRENLPRAQGANKNFAYLKIAEGCDNHCTFCVIPKIRGSYRSRREEDIINEAALLAQNGVTELIIIAQDTTGYGRDLYGEQRLHVLLEKLSEFENIKWIRLYYAYPELINSKLIDVIAKNKKICKYIDIPMQHVSDEILKKMGRKGSGEQYEKLISDLREKIPGVTIRSTFITGFPGETEDDFKKLYDFLDKSKLDKVGIFAYSKEEGTAAARMKNQIHFKTREKRRNILMELQQKISSLICQNKIGKVFLTVCGNRDGGRYIGRTEGDAPGIDGLVYFTSKRNIALGEYVKVKITGSMEYDLVGEEFMNA